VQILDQTDCRLSRHWNDRLTCILIDQNQLDMPFSITERHCRSIEA